MKPITPPIPIDIKYILVLIALILGHRLLEPHLLEHDGASAVGLIALDGRVGVGDVKVVLVDVGRRADEASKRVGGGRVGETDFSLAFDVVGH